MPVEEGTPLFWGVGSTVDQGITLDVNTMAQNLNVSMESDLAEARKSNGDVGSYCIHNERYTGTITIYADADNKTFPSAGDRLNVVNAELTALAGRFNITGARFVEDAGDYTVHEVNFVRYTGITLPAP